MWQGWGPQLVVSGRSYCAGGGGCPLRGGAVLQGEQDRARENIDAGYQWMEVQGMKI